MIKLCFFTKFYTNTVLFGMYYFFIPVLFTSFKKTTKILNFYTFFILAVFVFSAIFTFVRGFLSTA